MGVWWCWGGRVDVEGEGSGWESVVGVEYKSKLCWRVGGGMERGGV